MTTASQRFSNGSRTPKHGGGGGGLWSWPITFPLAGLSLMLIFMMLSHVYLRVKFGEILDFVSHIKNFIILLARGPPVWGSRSKIWEIKYQGLKTGSSDNSSIWGWRFCIWQGGLGSSFYWHFLRPCLISLDCMHSLMDGGLHFAVRRREKGNGGGGWGQGHGPRLCPTGTYRPMKKHTGKLQCSIDKNI